MVIGNSLKAGIRFVAFDMYKSMLQDEAGRISGPRTVIAGFGAGITESLLAVTPFESIKTSMWVFINPILYEVVCSISFEQHRRSEICQSTNEGFPSRIQCYISRTWSKGFLPRLRANNGTTSGKLGNQVWQLYNHQTVCARLCRSWREAGNSEHICHWRTSRLHHRVRPPTRQPKPQS